jgi:hypothetical protein
LQIFLKQAIFSNKKMIEYRKTPTQTEMIDQLRRGRVELPPLSLRIVEGQAKAGANRRLDALVEASWRGSKAKFAVECKAISTPRSFQDGMNRLKTMQLPKGRRPMLFLPFLGENQRRCDRARFVFRIPYRREKPVSFFRPD